jgi:hypothetical protein
MSPESTAAATNRAGVDARYPTLIDEAVERLVLMNGVSNFLSKSVGFFASVLPGCVYPRVKDDNENFKGMIRPVI